MPEQNFRTITTLLCIGWFLTMMSLLVGIGTPLITFIHMWKVEAAAALVIAAICIYCIVSPTRNAKRISRDELRFIVIPIAVFICWSGLSALWAPSWKSAIHHTLVWCLYLAFYLMVRIILDTRTGFRDLGLTVVAALTIFSITTVAGYVSFLIFGGENTLGIRFARYGEQVNTILPLLLVAVIRLTGKRFWLGTLAVVMMWLLVFCSLGRINLFLFGVGVLTTSVLIFAVPRFRRYRLKLGIIVAAIVISPLPLQLFTLLSNERSAAPVVLQRLNDSEALGRSNNFRSLMNNISLEMIRTNPLAGVGADNYGFQVHYYREQFAAANPDDPTLVEAEDGIPERAHNELLQILAELGAIGGVITLWIVSGLLLMAYRVIRQPANRSLFASAAVIGLGLFLVSSLISSFSFRLIQNGFVFVFALAVAARSLLKDTTDEAVVTVTPRQVRIAAAATLLPCLLLGGYWYFRVASVYYTNEADYTQNLVEARTLYVLAEDLDDENPDAPFNHGLRLFQEKRYREAIPYLEKAIDIGRARSFDFSYLASTYTLAGDPLGAELAMARALKLYPRSVFVLTRYAALINANGKKREAEQLFARASELNPRAANSWWAFLNDGPNAASSKAFWNKEEFSALMDLQPLSGVYAVKAERDILYPDEKFRFPFERDR